MKKTEFMVEFMMLLKLNDNEGKYSPLDRIAECEKFWQKHKKDLKFCTIEDIFVD